MDEKKNLIIEKNFSLAFQNHKKNNLQIAEDFYKKTLKINPNHFESIFYFGSLLVQTQRFELAKPLLYKAIKINPNYAAAHNNLGAALKELGENKNAINCYKKAIQIDSNYADAHNNLGIIYYQLEEYQKAIKCYEKAIQINPNYANAYNNLGNIFKILNDYQKAISSYEKAIQINPSYANALYNLGIIFYELGEYKKAIDCYEKAIQINPNYANAYNNLGNVLKDIEEYKNAINSYQKALKLEPGLVSAQANISSIYISQLDNLEKAISASYQTLKIQHKISKFNNQKISLYRLKHDVQQAKYLSSKNYKINGIEKFQKIGSKILRREENKKDNKNPNKKILLNQDEIDSLLPFYKENHIYQTSKISSDCLNPDKNWHEVEEQYFDSPKQIIYIDNFLSDKIARELREFCLVSKIWDLEYKDKYLGATSDKGFISPIHLQIAIDLKQKMPKLFKQHKLSKFWAFKYDTTLGKGINIHADFAIHNLNFWITPDKYNNNKNSGGLKVYDAPAPENWTFHQYNKNADEVYKFLNDNNAKCTTIPYKFNRAVLFNSAYFHETDKINFKDDYEARRINITYLFGNRLVKKLNSF